ncbi:MAG: discoidin domain-containing protein, partial [Candidatus Omnitrophica bacterium]|nr:discoidin domain-containing protein [Candidatus Omnitrophota bacterium]
WLKLDLKSEKEIDRIVYDSFLRPVHANAPYLAWHESFRIQGSLDGVNWFTVKEVSGKTAPERFNFQIPATKMRYLKVDQIKSHGQWDAVWHYAYLSEIEVYEKPGSAREIAPPQVTLLTPTLVHDPNLSEIRFLVDGQEMVRPLNQPLQEGNNDLAFRFNSAVDTFTVVFPKIKLDTVAQITKLNFENVNGTDAPDGTGLGNTGKLNGGIVVNTEDHAPVTESTKSLQFDGLDDYISIADSLHINLGIHTERSVSLWFNVEDASINTRKQVIYEEGGGGRGLNIYIYNGKLYVGGWNPQAPESNWQGTFLSTDITSGQWHHVALTLNGGATITQNAFKGYLDGVEFGSGAGSQLWEHPGDIGIGAMNEATKFHDELPAGTGHYFKGMIDEVLIYNRALTTAEIQTFAAVTNPPDKNPPTGSITISPASLYNGLYATSRDILLTLQASDSESGMDKMSFSIDGINWTTPENYSEEKIFNLPAGDGDKKVFVKYTDKKGNFKIAESQTIKLDTQKPEGWLWNGTIYTLGPKVTVSLNAWDDGGVAASGVDKIRFSVINAGEEENWQDWEDLVGEKEIILPPGEGEKIIAYEVRDKAGNSKIIRSANNAIVDLSAPVGGILINWDDQYTNILNSFLEIHAVDSLSGVAEMRLTARLPGDDPNHWFWTDWEEYTSRNYTLPDQDGLIEVHVQFHDVVGNYSESVYDRILLDRKPPAGTISVNGGVQYIRQTGATLDLSAADGLLESGIDQMSFSTDGVDWSDPEPYAEIKDWTFTSGDGEKKVYVKYSDKAGNWSEAVIAKVTLDTVPPVVSLLSPVLTNEPNYTLAYKVDGEVITESVKSLTEGNNVFIRPITDLAGNKTDVTWNITLDTKAPTGSIAITGDLTHTKETGIKLTLSGTDGTDSGVEKMSFSTDNVNWSAEENYAVTKDWTLSTGDGLKTIYVRYHDKAGNIGQSYFTSITLDTVKPVVELTSATLVRDASYTLKYKVDDVEKTESIILQEGINTISRSPEDKAGNKTDVTWNITLDSKAPDVVLTSPTLVNKAAYTLTYKVDGDPRSESLTLTEGENTIAKSIFDEIGNKMDVSWKVTLDSVAPSGTLKINNDASYANSQDVTLNLTASDATSGLDQMRFSTDSGTTWTAWENIASTKSLQLPVGDGTKEVQYQLRDKAGNLSPPIIDTITLDTTLPSGSVSIMNGNEYARWTQVDLTLTASDVSGIDKVNFSIDDGTTWKGWEDFAETRRITLPVGEGEKKVLFKVRDGAGNISTFFDTIILDQTKPTGTIKINDGASYTNSRNVTLTFSAQDNISEAYQMRYSINDGVTWVMDWNKFSASKTLQLPAGDGLKEVRWEIRDKAHNVQVYKAQITLDTIAPQGQIKINNDTSNTNSRDVTLNLTASDATSGLDQMRFSTDSGTTWTVWENIASTKSIQLPTGDGTKEVRYQLRDKAGNLSSAIIDTITLD